MSLAASLTSVESLCICTVSNVNNAHFRPGCCWYRVTGANGMHFVQIAQAEMRQITAQLLALPKVSGEMVIRLLTSTVDVIYDRLLLKCEYSSPALSRLPTGALTDLDGRPASSNKTEASSERALEQDLNILKHRGPPDLAWMNELFIKHKVVLVELANVFLSSCQRWVHIVHADMFRERCKTTQVSQDYFVLLVSMGMISRPFKNGSTPDSLRLTLYATVKKLFWEMIPLSQPTLFLVQAGLLVSVYEYGQGMLNSSYITISTCMGMAQVLGLCSVHPPPLPQLGTLRPQDEGLQTWWGIAIHERLAFHSIK